MFHVLKFIPVRGRKRPLDADELQPDIVEIYPREGTETLFSHNLSFQMGLKFIPVRGRKLFANNNLFRNRG